MLQTLPTNLKAILFDMDGVLLDSERVWHKYQDNGFWKECGLKKLPDTISSKIYGISMQEEYSIIKEELGIKLSLHEYIEAYDRYADLVYSEALLAGNLEFILSKLTEKHLKLSIVTSSLGKWVTLFIKKLQITDYFEIIVSIADHKELRPKPSPDGYLHAIELLGLSTDEVIAIEDSNRGIASAHSAGIFTIASAEFVNETYVQEGFDLAIPKLEKLIEIV